MDRVTVTGPERPDRPSDGGPSTMVIVFAVLTVFLSGAGIGWLVRPGPPAPEVSTATDLPTTTTTVADEPAVTDPAPRSTAPISEPSTAPLFDSSSGEPVADVADAVLPSVVEIQLGGPRGGLGSGVIYDPNGRIMTAAHVVQGFDQVTIQFSNGDRTPGTVVGVDSANDIAVIEVDMTGLPAAPLALDVEPRSGQLAVALGSPWGLDSTVTSGIISAVDQAILGEGNAPRLMLQTDASINPGNSGGPLVDRQGRVVGINVSIYSTSGANDGVGFAVPIDRAFRVATAIVEGRPYVAGFLGVVVEETESGLAGSVIQEITPGASADDAGLLVGDIIVRVDDDPIPNFTVLGAVVRNYEAGDEVEIEILRDGELMVFAVSLGSR